MARMNALDSDSDFGYDFTPEEEELLLQLAAAHHPPPLSLQADDARAAIDSVPGTTDSVSGDHASAIAFEQDLLPDDIGDRTAQIRPLHETGEPSLPTPAPVAEDVSYPDLSRALDGVANLPKVEAPLEISDGGQSADDRSPLQRFRSFPRKPLTVTDLTSGAWCELQYWYTLTRLPGGRRTRTAAMKQGSKVHQKLEDEVHTTVKIEIMTKEDGFGLRLWNLVQGLRTLRDTGLTRELEVWGLVDGNLVNGVIDGVSYENPNPDFEEELSIQESQLDQKQSMLTDFFPPKKPGLPARKIYLTDVKTRGSLAPVSNALLRPAKIQLLLYHRFLCDMADGKLDFLQVFRRYGLDADDTFSDAFVAQIGSLHDEIFVDAPSSSDVAKPGPDQVGPNGEKGQAADGETSSATQDLLKYSTLRELLDLVHGEIALTFPHGHDSVGHMLRVQYVYRQDGRELDLHDFPVSRQALGAYLDRYMEWWRGERKATGVDIEEAFKCRTCEFAPDCSWRQAKDQERVRAVREKLSTSKSAV